MADAIPEEQNKGTYCGREGNKIATVVAETPGRP
jgi:hypothetical protein